MAKDRRKLQHIHSSVPDKQPTPQSLEVGEIAVNNAAGKEFLSIRNSDDKVQRFSSDEQLITWVEKKEVVPYVGQVRGDDYSATTTDMGSVGITNDDLLQNKSNIVIKMNQVAAGNTPKSGEINAATDIYGHYVNLDKDGQVQGAGFSIDMSRYAMIGANPSFSSLTVTDKTDLSGNTTITDGDGTGTRTGKTLTIKMTNENETITTLNESATTRTTKIGTENLNVSGTTTEVHVGDVDITNEANVVKKTSGTTTETKVGNVTENTSGTTTIDRKGAVSENNQDNVTIVTSGTTDVTRGGVVSETNKSNVTINNKANVNETTDGNETELIKGNNYRDVNGNYSGTTGGTTTEVKTGAVSETNLDATDIVRHGAVTEDNKNSVTRTTSGTTTETFKGNVTENNQADYTVNTTGNVATNTTGTTTEVKVGNVTENTSGTTSIDRKGAVSENNQDNVSIVTSGATTEVKAGTVTETNLLDKTETTVGNNYENVSGGTVINHSGTTNYNYTGGTTLSGSTLESITTGSTSIHADGAVGITAKGDIVATSSESDIFITANDDLSATAGDTAAFMGRNTTNVGKDIEGDDVSVVTNIYGTTLNIKANTANTIIDTTNTSANTISEEIGTKNATITSLTETIGTANISATTATLSGDTLEVKEKTSLTYSGGSLTTTTVGNTTLNASGNTNINTNGNTTVTTTGNTVVESTAEGKSITIRETAKNGTINIQTNADSGVTNIQSLGSAGKINIKANESNGQVSVIGYAISDSAYTSTTRADYVDITGLTEVNISGGTVNTNASTLVTNYDSAYTSASTATTIIGTADTKITSAKTVITTADTSATTATYSGNTLEVKEATSLTFSGGTLSSTTTGNTDIKVGGKTKIDSTSAITIQATDTNDGDINIYAKDALTESGKTVDIIGTNSAATKVTAADAKINIEATGSSANVNITGQTTNISGGTGGVVIKGSSLSAETTGDINLKATGNDGDIYIYAKDELTESGKTVDITATTSATTKAASAVTSAATTHITGSSVVKIYGGTIDETGTTVTISGSTKLVEKAPTIEISGGTLSSKTTGNTTIEATGDGADVMVYAKDKVDITGNTVNISGTTTISGDVTIGGTLTIPITCTGITSSTFDDAICEVLTRDAITMEVTTPSAESEILKTYKLYQNGAQIGEDINIPKDHLLKNAEIVYGKVNGSNFTACTATSDECHWYIKLIWNVFDPSTGHADDKTTYMPADDFIKDIDDKNPEGISADASYNNVAVSVWYDGKQNWVSANTTPTIHAKDNIYADGTVSANTITAATDMRAGNVSANTITAATSANIPSITASTGVTAKTVSAETLTLATSASIPTISATTISAGTIHTSGLEGALSWSYGDTSGKEGGSYNGSAAKAITIPSDASHIARRKVSWSYGSVTSATEGSYNPGQESDGSFVIPNDISHIKNGVSTARTISAGTGLSGGGDLSVNRTLSLKTATSDEIGGIKTGYTTDGTNRNYAVQLSDGKAYVNVPWTDHYAWSDITSKPTTIGGYGITDASISDQKITLGSNSITVSSSTQVNDALAGKSGTGHTHNYAGSSSAGGAATSASKLNTDAGSSTTPVYFTDGVPAACTYSLNKTVPSDAVFTDHYAWSDITGKPESYTPSSHSHAISDVTDLQTTLNGKSDTGHTHDDRYYTESEIDTKLADKSNTGHTHDDRYYTESEIDTKLAGKSDTGHTHAISDVTGLQGALNGKSDTDHTHSIYVKKAGDTMTGSLTAVSFYASSDERLKENIENVTYAKTANAANVGIKSFNFKSDEEKKTVIGVIAQEVEKNNLGFIVSTDENGMKAVDYTSLNLLKIAYLEEKVKRLESMLSQLLEDKK